MIKKVILLSALGVAFFSLTGCKKEKQTHDIITKIAPKPRIPKTPIALKGFNYTKTVQWLGTQYTITIIRQTDKDLPLVNDEDGRKYYDNKISVKIMRKDGKDFYQKVFTKTDFSKFINTQYDKKGALVGFMFDRVDLNTLRFGASVGSPALASDEYVPIDVVIDNLGHISMAVAQTLDTGSDQQKTNKKPKDMIESAEEDGM